MSAVAFFGAMELGLAYGVVAFGVFMTFRMLEFPDLTVESSFPMGGAVAAALIIAGADPWLATAAAFAGGVAAGFVTAFLTVQFGVLHLLAGILTMIAGFSVNIRIMGAANLSLLGEKTIFTPLIEATGLPALYAQPLLVAVMSAAILVLLARFLLSDCGLALRAAGQNPRMLRAQGGDPGFYVYCGVMLSNGLVALGGAMFSQFAGFADVTTGTGTIVFGLAAVILGETLLPGKKIWLLLLACLLGSIVYRLFIALTLSAGVFGLQASDLNLITALLVTLALIAPKLRRKLFPPKIAADD